MSVSEYEHEPVPLEARRSLFSVATVWAGFPMVMIGAFVGGTVVTGLGFIRGLLAIIVGNLILAAYVACLSALAARQGKTFGLSAQGLFGPSGAKVVLIGLSTLVVGWFAVQTGLAGQGLHSLSGLPVIISTMIVGATFMVLSIAGMRMLKPLSIVSITLFIIVAIVSLVINAEHASLHSMMNYQGNGHQAMALGAGITLAISSFVDSGTLTADFTRWSKTPKQAVLASLCAFPCANMLPMLLGAIVVAGGASIDGDFSRLLSQWGPMFGTFAALFFIINCSSVAVHGLYNAAAGWSSLVPLNFRPLVVILGIFGTLLAMAGITQWLIGWLSLLGIVVPGIGGAIIGWMMVGQGRYAPKRLLTAWGISVVCGAITEYHAPELSVAFVSIMSGLVVSIIALLLSPKLSMELESH